MAFRDVTRLAFVLLSCLVHVGISSRRPNIVIIMADDLGWNDVSFHGSNQIPTPNIDALAYDGIILNTHYVPALCTPSRASLLTGKYPTSMGMQHLVILAPEPWGLPLEETLMPEHLKRHGYATHAVGKWHLGFHQKAYTPTHRGFDTHFGYWNGYQDYYDHTMEDHTLEGAPQPLKGYDMRRGLDVDYASRGEYSTDAFTNEAVHIIRSHNATQGPLFLYLAHLSPHSGNPDKPFQAPDDEIAKHSHITDPERRVYAAMVTRLDDGVGRVVSALREADLLENSIILFLSDNGAVTFGVHSNRGSNYPLRGLKESPWEGGVRGVAALWSPLLNRTRRVSNQLMHACDWLPTLYSAAGLNTSELGQIDGMDMWETLSQDRESPRTEVFNNYDEIEGYSSLRIGAWKYIEGTAQGGDVDLWYGESGEEAAYTGYDVEGVLHSKTGVAIIGHSTDRQLKDEDIPPLISRDEILRLRRASVVTCEDTPFGANLTGDVSELRGRILRELEDIRYKYPFADVMTYEMDRRAVDELKDKRDVDELFACDPLKMVCVFNLETDPCERVNLARIFPELVGYLQARLSVVKGSVVKPRNVAGDPFCDPVLHNGTWSNWRDYVTTADYESESDAFIDSVTSALRARMRDFLFLLVDNVVLKIVYSPILFVVNEFLQLFIHDGKSIATTAAFVLLTALCLTVYNLVKRFASDTQDDDKGFSVTLSTTRKVSSRFVKR